jgi:accessory colonization factor AcfC
MKNKWLMVLIGTVMSTMFCASLHAQEKVLKLYVPGGVDGVVKECADMFAKTSGVRVEVTTGQESKWIGQARQESDLIFGGTESIMSDLISKYPGLIDEATRTHLYVRGTGIVVRKGNPKQITTLADLAKSGMRLIDVTGPGLFALWEDSAGGTGLIPAIQRNTLLVVSGGAEAAAKWKSMTELDAWITLEPWHYQIKDSSDFIPLPEANRIYRGASIAVTQNSRNKDAARQFIAFLQTEPAHAAFQRRGWK